MNCFISELYKDSGFSYSIFDLLVKEKNTIQSKVVSK